MEVHIDSRGAILVGENFTIDGHWKKNFRVVTHFHSDHTLQLERSVEVCYGIISTPATHDVLKVLGYKVPLRKEFRLNYGMRADIDNEFITLHPSDHVFGSAQVEILTSKGTKVVYTGDFKSPGTGTPILDADVLIIESTYGRPDFVRPFKDDVPQLFADYVNDAVTKGPVRVFAYHGKVQEAMRVLRSSGVIAPFVADGKVRQITEVAMKHGMKLKDVFSIQEAKDQGIIRTGWYVEFKHFNEFWKRDGSHFNFLLSGWEFVEPIKKVGKNSFSVAFSDHADFEDLIYYIDNSRAGLIVAEGGRRGYSKELASYVSEVLKRRSISLPSK